MSDQPARTPLYEHPAFNPGQDVPCAKHPEWFEGPPKGMKKGPVTLHEAYAIHVCRSCPVLDRCRDWALIHAIHDTTVMGGMTGHQRRQAHERKRKGRPFVIPKMTPPNPKTAPLPPPPDKPPLKCKNDHPPENMYIRPDGTRRCKQCQAEYDKKRRAHRTERTRQRRKDRREGAA